MNIETLYPHTTIDDDTTKKKIRVEIKPVVANGSSSVGGSSAISASVDELQRAVGGLELVPLPLVSPRVHRLLSFLY